MRSLWFIFSIIFFIAQSGSQPTPDFSPPVQGVIELTGTFCELRADHFHAGIDIRGPVGRPIYAIADGFIKRIVVSVSGYGQGLYLEHPGGYTSVYGHLDRFRDDVMDYTRTQQYTQESFQLDEELSPDIFPVRKGDLIGYMGQRGFVSGPHLHFEIRETHSGRNLNPLNFGIPVADDRRPFISSLRVYELDERGTVLRGRDFAVRSRGGGSYSLANDTVRVQSPYYALGIKAYDQQNGRDNFNGIYRLQMWQQDSLRFAYQMDHFDVAQTRYLNAHLDYGEQRVRNSWFQRAYRMPGNALDFYQSDTANGRLQLAHNQADFIRFAISDHQDNDASLQLAVKQQTNAPPLQNRVYNYYLPYDEENLIDNASLRAHFPPGALYEDLYLDYDLVMEQTQGLYAPVHRIHRSSTPLHRYYDLHLRPNHIPENLRPKALIAYCEDGDAPISFGGEWTPEGRLRAPVRAFGNFTIMVDSTPPTITPERFGSDMRGWDRFSFRLADDFPTAGKANGLQFRAEVDGRWILMEFDGLKSRLYHVFDGRIPPGSHTFRLIVKDDRGNTSVFEQPFVR
ncbi:MAG: M23 family metallopeptidase [Saprospiraceae bacterium]